jgi:hypothetical protein
MILVKSFYSGDRDVMCMTVGAIRVKINNSKPFYICSLVRLVSMCEPHALGEQCRCSE